MLPWQTFIDHPALPHLRLKQLPVAPKRVALPAHPPANSAGLQIAVEGFQQMGPANVVNQDLLRPTGRP